MKKKKWPFVYVALITVLTYIPILLTVVYSCLLYTSDAADEL